MGNNAPKSALPGQTISFTATKAEYSTSKDIVGVFIDDSLLPKGGVFVVGHSSKELIYTYKFFTHDKNKIII